MPGWRLEEGIRGEVTSIMMAITGRGCRVSKRLSGVVTVNVCSPGLLMKMRLAQKQRVRRSSLSEHRRGYVNCCSERGGV